MPLGERNQITEVGVFGLVNVATEHLGLRLWFVFLRLFVCLQMLGKLMLGQSFTLR